METIIGAFQFGIEFNKTTKREEIVRLQTNMEEFRFVICLISGLCIMKILH